MATKKAASSKFKARFPGFSIEVSGIAPWMAFTLGSLMIAALIIAII